MSYQTLSSEAPSRGWSAEVRGALVGLAVGSAVCGAMLNFDTTTSLFATTRVSPTVQTQAPATIRSLASAPQPHTTRQPLVNTMAAQNGQGQDLSSAQEFGFPAQSQGVNAFVGPALALLGAFLAGAIFGRREAKPSVAIAPMTGINFGQTPEKSSRRLAPLQGRRSEKIAHTKGREDAKRAKLYGRYGKKIIMAIKAGGSNDPESNIQLRDVIREAKNANVPATNIERCVKRGGESNTADYKESLFEAYGKGGAGIMITVLSDNANRASSEVKSTIGKAGLTVASSGSVAFNFTRRGAIMVEKQISEDEAIEAAMEADIDDVEVIQNDDGDWMVLTEPKDTTALKEALIASGVNCGESLLIYHPNTLVEVSDEDMAANDAAIQRLQDLDDVDVVDHNMA